jgi:Tol biopolymer transport system component/DNA-binding winged helix-turn-helix (wHTH) protein
MSLDLSLNYPDFKIGMDNTGNNAIYEFDRFRLDAGKLMLYCDDAEVSMPPKMVKTLAVLVESRGTIVSKDELLERVWSDTIVDESNLSQHLYHLRKVLGDLPDGRPHIETLRRRGYRFNGDVRRVEAPKIDIPSVAPRTTPIKHQHAEREGNVLRLVDWKATQERQVEDSPVESEPDAKPTASPSRSIRPALLIGFAFLLITAAAVVVFKFGSSATPEAAANTEISIMRLTSGIAPNSAALAPNGDYFAYHESTDGGERLWLQQVGQANRVNIGEAPKGSVYGAKTFSPDGKSLFFSLYDLERNKAALYRIPTIGGPPVKVLDDVGNAISFSPDGKEFVWIRHGKSGETSLIVVDKDGQSQRTLLERTGQLRLVGSPAWSPDGKTIVFGAMDADNSTGIYATDTSGAGVRRISNERWDNAYRIAWTPDGRGLVMIATRIGDGYTTRRNQVYFVSYPDGASRRLTSDGLRYDELSLGVSNDEAIIALPLNRSSQIWSLASSGASSTAIQISRGLIDGRAGMATLPDGRIGYNSKIGEEVGIWIMNADGTGINQLPTGAFPIVEEIRADPKGRFFVFSGYKDGFSNLYRFDPDGNNFTQLTSGDQQPLDSTISPDGSTIVYSSATSGNVVHPSKLFKITIDGGKPERIGDVVCETPHYSPGGDMLSCIRGEELVVVSPSDGSILKTFRLSPYARVNFGVRWMPDGKGLVYIRSEKAVGNLWIQPLDGGQPKQLTDFTFGDMYNYAFSSDGTRLFVARGQQVSDVILIRNFR